MHLEKNSFFFLQSSPEATKDRAMEADRLFRRGCSQYLEDVGLTTKAHRRVINPSIQRSQQSDLFYLPSQNVELRNQHECGEHRIDYLTAGQRDDRRW